MPSRVWSRTCRWQISLRVPCVRIRRAYREFRHYLLETSQITGGFYAAAGRRRLIRQVVDMMLSPEDPYDALTSGKAAPRQHLLVVR